MEIIDKCRDIPEDYCWCCLKGRVKRKKTLMPITHNLEMSGDPGKCCAYLDDERRKIPKRYCCYCCWISCECFWFNVLCFALIIERFTNLLLIPYDHFKSREFVLFLVILMAMQCFVGCYSWCSMRGENTALFIFGTFTQAIVLLRCFLFYLNYDELAYSLPLVFQIIVIFPHFFCGYCSCRNYRVKKFNSVNRPAEQKLFDNWKMVEGLLYFDAVNMFVIVILGLFTIEYSVQFYIYGFGYLMCSLVVIYLYVNKCYHEQWKCCTILYIFFQFNLVLYLVYKCIMIISGLQSDEIHPIWDDNEYWHLVNVFINLGSSGFAALVFRILTFIWLVYTMTSMFDGRLTIALKNRPPYPGPHWYCLGGLLYFVRFCAIIESKVCCIDKCKCSCCGLREMDGWSDIVEFIRGWRGANTTEEDLELLGDSGEVKLSRFGKIKRFIKKCCYVDRACTKVYYKVCRRRKDISKELEDDEEMEDEDIDILLDDLIRKESELDDNISEIVREISMDEYENERRRRGKKGEEGEGSEEGLLDRKLSVELCKDCCQENLDNFLIQPFNRTITKRFQKNKEKGPWVNVWELFKDCCSCSWAFCKLCIAMKYLNPWNWEKRHFDPRNWEDCLFSGLAGEAGEDSSDEEEEEEEEEEEDEEEDDEFSDGEEEEEEDKKKTKKKKKKKDDPHEHFKEFKKAISNTMKGLSPDTSDMKERFGKIPVLGKYITKKGEEEEEGEDKDNEIKIEEEEQEGEEQEQEKEGKIKELWKKSKGCCGKMIPTNTIKGCFDKLKRNKDTTTTGVELEEIEGGGGDDVANNSAEE